MPEEMNIRNKLYQEFVLDIIEATDWAQGADAPLVVELDTTEACNLACPGCISADLIEYKRRFSDERLMRLAEEFVQVGVKAVILIGGGEPLAHPEAGDFMEYLGKHDIHIGITTNGSFIDKHLDFISRYSSWTRVSIDAATDDMFNKLRPSKSGKSEFGKIIDNMRQLGHLKKGKLGFSYLIRTEADGFGLGSNIHEIYEAAVLARDIGCDYFEVKPGYSFAGGVDHELVKHDPARMQEAREEIERLSELETVGFSISKAINLKYSLNGVTEMQSKDYTSCPVTELRTLICPSGVYVCPYWRGKERFCVGDLQVTGFAEMWNSKRRKQVQEFLDPSKHCGFHCLRHESNLEIMDLDRRIKAGEQIDHIHEYDRFI